MPNENIPFLQRTSLTLLPVLGPSSLLSWMTPPNGPFQLILVLQDVGCKCHTLPYRVGQVPATKNSLCQSLASSIAMVTVSRCLAPAWKLGLKLSRELGLPSTLGGPGIKSLWGPLMGLLSQGGATALVRLWLYSSSLTPEFRKVPFHDSARNHTHACLLCPRAFYPWLPRELES